MEDIQSTAANDSTKDRLRRIDAANADFLAEIKAIQAEQKKLDEKVRKLLENARMKKVLEKIVSIK